MNKKRIMIGVIAAAVLIAGVSVYAQMNRPYRNGTVWTVAFIRIKPGIDVAYMNYLASSWKAEQEAQKKEGNIISYKVLSVEGPHARRFQSDADD